MVLINGENVIAEGKSLQEYLLEEGYQMKRIAVECNGRIVSKAEYETTIINENDTLEIVSFVGGG